MGETSATTIRSGGIGILNEILTTKKAPIKFSDVGESTLANQGAYIPLVIGRRRLAPVFAYEGLGVTVPLPKGDLNIFDIGRSLITGNWDNLEDTHWRPGWHPICIGPAKKLHMIYRDGRPIIRTPRGLEAFLPELDSSVVASGATIPMMLSIDLFSLLSDLFGAIFDAPVGALFDIMADVIGDVGQDTEGIFSIYWGEANQPTNAALVLNSLLDGIPAGVSTLSRWPYICSVYWAARFLGTSENWPNLEYEIEVRPRNTVATLSSSSSWINSTINLEGIDNSGANPAHALLQLLCEPAPHGMGIPASEIDMDSLEALGVLCENEHLPINIQAGGGESGARAVADILQNVGVTMSQLDGKQYFIPIRTPDPDQDEFLQFVDSSTLQPPPDVDMVHGPKPVNRMVFTYDDGSPSQQFRQRAIAFSDDSDSIERPLRTQNFSLENIIDPITAYAVAERRAQEELAASAIYKFRLGRRARALLPGAPIFVEGYPILRVVSVRPQTNTSAVEVDAIVDHYGVDPGPFTPAESETNLEIEPRIVQPGPDIAFRIIEKPFSLQRGSPVDDNFLFFRVPTVEALKRGQLHVKYGSEAYTLAGRTMRPSLGGTLESAWSDGRYMPDVGPIVVADGPEWLDPLDLSGDDASWRAGRLWFIVDDEICFAQSVTALGERRWQINGIIRARFDTFKVDHAQGARVYLQDSQLARSMKVHNNSVTYGVVIRAKSQPMNVRGETVPLSYVTEQTVSAVDKARGPLTPGRFRCNHTAWRRNTYVSGGNLSFAWRYNLRDGEMATPIDMAAGQALSEAYPRALHHLGSTETELTDGSTTKTYSSSSQGFTLTNATLISDFGGQPATLTARIRAFFVENNITRFSAWSPQITITKI